MASSPAGRIYQRGRSWYVDVELGGERVRRSAGPSKVEARRMLRELRRDAAEFRRYVGLADVFRSYASSLRLRGKANSVGQAEIHLNLLTRHYGRGFNAAALTAVDVDGFVRKRRREGRAAASVNGSLRYLRAALRHAGLEAPVKLLRETRQVPRILRAEDVQRLLDAAREPIDVVVLLAAKAGLRHQEILHLQRADVDLETQTVHVSAKEGWTPKSHYERVVPFSDRLRERLARHIAALVDPSPYAWLFPGLDGGCRSNVGTPIREAFKTAGLYKPETKPGLHQLRRTWASTLLANGVDIETVRELGGWSSLDVVQRYLASTDALKRRAIESLN